MDKNQYKYLVKGVYFSHNMLNAHSMLNANSMLNVHNKLNRRVRFSFRNAQKKTKTTYINTNKYINVNDSMLNSTN